MFKPLLRAMAVLACAGALAPAWAADRSRVDLPFGETGPVSVDGRNLAEARAGDFSRLTAFDVTVTWSYRRRAGAPAVACSLSGDRAVIWVRRKAAKNASAKKPWGRLVVYVEGNVLFRHGRDRVEAERFIYDLGANRGYASQCRIASRLAYKKGGRQEADFSVRAESIRLELAPDGPKRLEARGASFTDCTFGKPHHDLYASRVSFETGAGQTIDEAWFEAAGIQHRFLGIPWFWLPWVGWKLDWRPLLRVRPGLSSKHGAFVDSAVGLRFRAEGEKGRGRDVARAWLPLAWFDKRGVGTGLRGDYKNRPRGEPDRGLDRMEGEWDAFYIHDRGDRRDEARDRGLYPLETSDRWRTYLFHRHRLPWGFDLDAEVNAYSDRAFLLEFYEDEWKTRKPPETYLLLRNNQGPLGFSALGKVRANPFVEAVEYLPRLRAWLMPQTVAGDWLGLGSRLEVSRCRRRPDNDEPTLHTEEGWRFDWEGEAAASFLWGPLAWSAFLRPRFSAFETSALPDGRAVDRTALTWGFQAHTWMWRVYEGGAPFAWAERLRHVVMPKVEYSNVCYLDRRPADLLRFDEMEDLDRLERVSFRLENRVQALEADGDVVDVLFLDLAFAWFPRPDRDNGGDDFSALTYDLRLAPHPAFSLWVNGVYDLEAGRMDQWNAGLRLALGPLRLDLGTTNVKGAVHTATAVADVTFSPRWSVRFQETYDCERNDMVDASLRLRRKLHCWVLEFGVAYDRGEDNVTWLFSFLPALFADDPRAQLVHTGMFQ